MRLDPRRRRSAASIAGSCHSGRRKPLFSSDGDLALVDRQRRTAAAHSDPNERMRWHGMLTHIATDRGYKPGWVGLQVPGKFGTWPPVRNVAPIEPTPEVLSWVRQPRHRLRQGKSQEQRGMSRRNQDKDRLRRLCPY